MNLADIERNVSELDFGKGFDFIYDLLLAYDLPKSGVTLLRKGTRDLLPESPPGLPGQQYTRGRDSDFGIVGSDRGRRGGRSAYRAHNYDTHCEERHHHHHSEGAVDAAGLAR